MTQEEQRVKGRHEIDKEFGHKGKRAGRSKVTKGRGLVTRRTPRKRKRGLKKTKARGKHRKENARIPKFTGVGGSLGQVVGKIDALDLYQGSRSRGPKWADT